MASGGAHRAIEKEIVSERASALARTFEALERALQELARADASRQARLREHLLDEARERLWFLVVQREALGLTRHDVIYEALEVPGEVRHHMGPRRR